MCPEGRQMCSGRRRGAGDAAKNSLFDVVRTLFSNRARNGKSECFEDKEPEPMMLRRVILHTGEA
jgi:hypothetical protein